MAKNEKTSEDVGTKASKLLSSSRTSKAVKSVAASALTQRPDKIKRAKKQKSAKRRDRCQEEPERDRRNIYDW